MNFDFENKKVVVMGLGLNNGGVGVAKFFAKNGANVLVTDLKSESDLEKSLKKIKQFPNIKYHLGGHIEDDFKESDLVIKNPAVPYTNRFIKIAKKNKIPIETDISLFLDLCPGEIIGITGTKGKSTVSTLIYEILKTEYRDTVLAGNIGYSPLEFLSKIKPTTKIVLELSSFELEELDRSPKISVVTSILPDHLDRYKDFEKYINSKKTIYKFHTSEDSLVLNYDYPETRAMAKETKGKVIFYSGRKEKDCFVKNGVIFFREEEICKVSDLKVFGETNISNAMAAICVAKILSIPIGKINKAVKTFSGISHRQEFVREIKGTKYFNDSAATMPYATVEALRSFNERFPDGKIILIAGGQDKGLDYQKLRTEIKRIADYLILLPGSGSDKIRENLKFKNTINVSSMAEAIKSAAAVAERGDIVILSPGAASFNLFKNEFDRGEKFIFFVKKLK